MYTINRILKFPKYVLMYKQFSATKVLNNLPYNIFIFIYIYIYCNLLRILKINIKYEYLIIFILYNLQELIY